MDSIKADVTGAADQGGTGLMKASSPVSRRTVVATGVAAAWAIPVIQLATAAPALAASTVTLSWPGFTAAYPNGDASKVEVTGSVTYSGGKAATDFMVTITLDQNMSGATVTPSGSWTVTGSGKSFTLIPASQPSPGDVKSFDVKFTPVTSNGSQVNVTGLATAGGTGAGTQATAAAVANLSLSNVTAGYGSNGTDAGLLNVTVPLANMGSADASGTKMKVSLPFAGAMVSVAPSSNWVPDLPNTTSQDFVYTLGTLAAQAAAPSFSMTFKMPDRNGLATSVTVSALATGVFTRSQTATVAATPNDTLAINGFNPTATNGNKSNGNQHTLELSNTTVVATGGTNTGVVTLVVTVPSGVGKPTGVPSVSSGWDKTAPAVGTASNGTDFTVTFTSNTGITAATPTGTASTPSLTATINIPNSANNKLITADASAAHAGSAHASGKP